MTENQKKGNKVLAAGLIAIGLLALGLCLRSGIVKFKEGRDLDSKETVPCPCALSEAATEAVRVMAAMAAATRTISVFFMTVAV